MNAVEAQQVCQSAEQALRNGSLHLHHFPGLLKRVINERLWERRHVPGQGTVELSSLRELITAKPLRGWGQNPTLIEAVIRDDAEVLTLWRAAMKPARGRNQHASSDDNIIAPRTPKGTSRAYTLDRLQRERPDLFAQVKAKKLSAHAAAQMAGFRAKTVSVHPTVEGFARAAVRYLDPPSLCTLLEAILDRLDMKAAQAAMKEKGRHIPLAELKKTLGL